MSDVSLSTAKDGPGGAAPIDGKSAGFAPRIVVGKVFEDRWATPYVRGEFDLPPGDYMLQVEVWNPPHPEFEGNEIVVRSGLRLLYATGPLAAEEGRLIELPLALSEYIGALSISIRSQTEWRPPPPDRRRVGFALLSWLVRPVAAGDDDGDPLLPPSDAP